MPMKQCPRCKAWMPYGPSYCTRCAPLAKAELEARREENLKRKTARYNRQRDPRYTAFYKTKAWRMTSRAKLQSVAYRCEAKLDKCTGLAVEVHHIKPIRTPEGWDLRLEWSNLEAVCTNCHNGRHPEKGKRAADAGVIDLRTVER